MKLSTRIVIGLVASFVTIVGWYFPSAPVGAVGRPSPTSCAPFVNVTDCIVTHGGKVWTCHGVSYGFACGRSL